MALLPRQFYAQRVLTCSPRKEIELPWPREIEYLRIEKTLFDWRLYYRKNKNKYMSLKSQWEARYLKIWIKYGHMRVEMPMDEKALEQITVDLEALVEIILKVADRRLVGYRESTQRKVLENVWRLEEEMPEEIED